MTGGEQSALSALASLTAVALAQPAVQPPSEEAISTIVNDAAQKRKADEALTDDSQSPPKVLRRASTRRAARVSSLTSTQAPEEQEACVREAGGAALSSGETGQKSVDSEATLNASQSSGEEASVATKRPPTAQGKPMYQCGYCKTIKTSVSAGSDGRVRIRCECGGKRMDGVHRMHANWDPVAWAGAKHAALGNARPMAHKNRHNSNNAPVLMAQAPKVVAAVVHQPVGDTTGEGSIKTESQPVVRVLSSEGKELKSPPFLVIDVSHNRPWALGPGRGKLGHGDLKQIPCYKPTSVIEQAKTINTPLQAEDSAAPAPTMLSMSAPTTERTTTLGPGVVDAEVGLMHLASLV